MGDNIREKFLLKIGTWKLNHHYK